MPSVLEAPAEAPKSPSSRGLVIVAGALAVLVAAVAVVALRPSPPPSGTVVVPLIAADASYVRATAPEVVPPAPIAAPLPSPTPAPAAETAPAPAAEPEPATLQVSARRPAAVPAGPRRPRPMRAVPGVRRTQDGRLIIR